MPCIHMETNCTIAQEAAEKINQELGKAISLFPGKSQKWLMCVLKGDCFLSFAGESKEPAAFVEVKLFGAVDPQAAQTMTGTICGLLQETLGIQPERVYVRYQETAYWGWNGENF